MRQETGKPWAPYCLKCDTLGRMTRTDYGYVCEGIGDHFGRSGCGNKINLDLLPQKPTEGKD